MCRLGLAVDVGVSLNLHTALALLKRLDLKDETTHWLSNRDPAVDLRSPLVFFFFISLLSSL